MLISPDHPTFLRTKTHSHGYVPWTICGTGIEADRWTTYDEDAANAADLGFDGYDMAQWSLLGEFGK